MKACKDCAHAVDDVLHPKSCAHPNTLRTHYGQEIMYTDYWDGKNIKKECPPIRVKRARIGGWPCGPNAKLFKAKV